VYALVDTRISLIRHRVAAYTQPMQRLDADSRALADFLRRHPKSVVLTGAGVSAASGIPTYRDAAGTWLHSEPIQERDFLARPHSRQRYWARSWYGWPPVRDARPNAAHHALAELERQGRVELLITQNVDRLHQAAGSTRVVDLHGRLDRVRCLACRRLDSREAAQRQLAADNDWPSTAPVFPRPDGDVDIDENVCLRTRTPRCLSCDGDLMPDVVFFGGNVPAARVRTCTGALENADALLVVGSSLKVYSGFRFCRLARRLGKPLAIVNPGRTRADDLADLCCAADAGPLLTRVAERLGGSGAVSPCAPGNPS
jgi:NAD-dependent SIR2 family protein deacetylase